MEGWSVLKNHLLQVHLKKKEGRQECQEVSVHQQGASGRKHKKKFYREWKHEWVTWEDYK